MPATKSKTRNPLHSASDWFREGHSTIDRIFQKATEISRSYWSSKPEDQLTDTQRADRSHDILGACASMRCVVDVLQEAELRRPLVMAENWMVFKTHVPAGAYLPVGQLDGDCRKCGVAWPCKAVLDVIGPETSVFYQRATEQLVRVQEVADRD